MTDALIQITQRRIEDSLNILGKEISNYERLVNNIQLNIDRLNSLSRNPRFDKYSASGQETIDILMKANEDMREISRLSLREIDNITSVISGYLGVLIEECIINYSSKLKIWIRIRLRQLVDLREIKIQDANNYIPFPTAVATLIPYTIKTRACDKGTSERLVSIRNLIKSLAELSY